jgi:hypothetical protein
LSDVHDFGGAFSDHVDTKDLPRFGVK